MRKRPTTKFSQPPKMKQGGELGSTVRGAATSVASAIPGPWGKIVATGIQLGGMVTDKGTDEFGVYKNKGAAIASRLVDPLSWLSPSQKNLKELRDKTLGNRAINNQADQIDQNASLTPETPMYTPPAYGKKGMKFKTRFSK